MLDLTARDREMLEGDHGPGVGLAMKILTHTAEAMGADRLLDVTGAHIDACVFYGLAGLEFAERLRDGGATVAVPTTLNISSLDLLHPELYRGSAETRGLAARLMTAYSDMGGRPTWTCAPYQLAVRPDFGDQIAWAESNAIVFANSVLGARTNRYGDFIDISCAVTGRAPAAGLHLDANRGGDLAFDLAGIPESLMTEDVFFPVLGHLIGLLAGNRIPVITGLAAATEDQLKALGAAAASSGSVALFHLVGVTPEAPTLEAATQGRHLDTIPVTGEMLIQARDQLTTRTDGELTSVSIGTPHLSVEGFARLADLVGEMTPAPGLDFYVNTGRDVLAEAQTLGLIEPLVRAGVQIVTDTCTYVTPILKRSDGVVMTDSGKWAWYAPGNLGVEVAFGSMKECVMSAAAGRVVRDPELWHGL